MEQHEYEMTMLNGIVNNLTLEFKDAVKKGHTPMPLGWVVTNKIGSSECELHLLTGLFLYFKDSDTKSLIPGLFHDFMKYLTSNGNNPIAVIIIYDSSYMELPLPEELQGSNVTQKQLEDFAEKELPVRKNAQKKDCILTLFYTKDLHQPQMHPYEIIGKVVVFKEPIKGGDLPGGILKNPFDLI